MKFMIRNGNVLYANGLNYLFGFFQDYSQLHEAIRQFVDNLEVRDMKF